MGLRLLLPCLLAASGCGRIAFTPQPIADANLADSPPFDAPRSVLPTTNFGTDSGFAYIVAGPVGSFGTIADATGAFERSTLRLFEDDIELGPPHSWHIDIRNLGLGRFSHWNNSIDQSDDSIRFAASDNSDPRTNGRTYSYSPW